MERNRKSIRWASIKVGALITVSLVIVFLAVMFAGNIEKMFSPRVAIYAIFDDVKGLKKGAPVWFSGLEIGYVEFLEFMVDHQVRVEITIESHALKYLKQDSKASILTLGLLGDKYVELSPGSRSAASLNPGDQIFGVTTTEIKDVVKTTEESIHSLKVFIDMLEMVLVKIERGEGTLAMLLRDPKVYKDLRGTTRSLDVFATRLAASKGTLNKMIEDDELYENFNRAADNLNNVSKKLNTLLDGVEQGKGLIGQLVKEDELADELKSTITELNALIKDIKENPKKYFKFSIF